jgi:hypothetical protein
VKVTYGFIETETMGNSHFKKSEISRDGFRRDNGGDKASWVGLLSDSAMCQCSSLLLFFSPVCHLKIFVRALQHICKSLFTSFLYFK